MPHLLGRRVGQALLVAACVLGAAGGIALVFGGGRWRVGPVAISLQSPLRTIALGIGLLMLRDALRVAPTRVPWPRGVLLAAALAAVLVFDSRPRVVGDGLEYVAMTSNLSRGRPPALLPEERAAVESTFAPAPGALGVASELLTGPDGRQDFHHFWLYSLLVAPFFAAAAAAGGPPLAGFAAANLLLLVLAAAVVHRRAGPGAVLVLFAGPLLWWVDKPHPEVFFVTVLAAALALAPVRPEWALPLAALAAAQNPVFLPVLVVGSLWACLLHRGRPRLWVSLLAAWALAALRPLYYLLHLGRPEPLRETVLPHIPGVAEAWAVLGDPNLGLFTGWPAMGVLALLGAAMAATRLRRPSPATADVLALASALLALLVLFTQPGNINHGGTRGMSRYALWLVPFAVPVVVALGARTGALARVGLAGLGVLSLFSLIPEYLPARPERYLEPTPFARWIWTRHPGLDRPLPECSPSARGGTRRSAPCRPRPRAARRPSCAATGPRSGSGLSRARRPRSRRPAARRARCATRTGDRRTTASCVRRLSPRSATRACSGGTGRARRRSRFADELRALPWRDLGLVDPKDESDIIADRHGAGRLQLRTAAGAYLVWLDGARQGDAWLAPRALRPATAILVDPLTGEDLGRTELDPDHVRRIALPPRAPLLLVVRGSALRRPGPSARSRLGPSAVSDRRGPGRRTAAGRRPPG